MASGSFFFFFFFPFFFRSLSLRLFLSLLFFFSCHYLSLSLSFLSTVFATDLHNPHLIPFMTTHLVMTESSSASTITLSPSLPTPANTKKKAIPIQYSQMRWRDSGGGVAEETVSGEREEGDFGARLWVCLIWDGF